MWFSFDGVLRILDLTQGLSDGRSHVGNGVLQNILLGQKDLNEAAGSVTALTVQGEFSDGKLLTLPSSFLHFQSTNRAVAAVTDAGTVDALSDGTAIVVGGKTGTGDNEFRVYGPKGGLLGSRVVNRTAAFAFFIGDRFFGTILAFVPGRDAADYKFTSALAVQVLKDLSPVFSPLIETAR